MIVLLRCPAWNSLAMLGDENSTIIFFLPLEKSDASLTPFLGLVPYALVDLRISGMTLFNKGSPLKKKETKGPD
jgi:hypothetical protein